MVRIHEYINRNNLDIKIRIQVHDELVLEGALEVMKLHVEAIRNIMSSVYPAKNGIVLTTSASYSEKSFAERDMKKWEW
jgi:DNA polymerase I-like protein with 3'-5' exonuclease and polymerase domains